MKVGSLGQNPKISMCSNQGIGESKLFTQMIQKETYETWDYPLARASERHQAAGVMRHSCILVFCMKSAAKLSLHAVFCRAVCSASGAQDHG